jgi:hypothetical protein
VPQGIAAAPLPMHRAGKKTSTRCISQSRELPVPAIKRKRISRARYPPPLLVIFIEKVLLLERPKGAEFHLHLFIKPFRESALSPPKMGQNIF